jgi:general secretion pathway protein L
MARKTLGIDIRNNSVVAVMVSGSRQEYFVEACAEIPIPPETEENDSAIAAAFETLAETMDLGDCDCAVSFPSAWFSYRNIQVPFHNHKKIRMVLPFELEPTLPYTIDERELDFLTIKTREADNNTNLLAATIEKAKLDPFFEALKNHKIDPECATISGLPSALCLAHKADPEEDQLFIDIDERSSTLVATAGGQIQLVRSFPLPTSAAAQSNMLGSQIQHTLAAFEEMELPEFKPVEIFISGRGLEGSNHVESISRALNSNVQRTDLTERLSVTVADDAADSWKSPRMQNALALTLMGFDDPATLNFHRGQFAIQKFLTKNKPQVIRTAILAAAVLALFVITATVEFYTLYKKTSRLDRQKDEIYLATFPEAKIIQDSYQEMNARIQEARKKSAFTSQAGPHVRRIDILNNISKQIPEKIEVDITRLSISPQNVIIAGNTSEFDFVEDIRGRLEQIDFFQKVSTSSANMDRSGKEVRFILKAEF